MPRRKLVYGTSLFYKGYKINNSYTYDEKQLEKILSALKFYSDQSKFDRTSNYVVFEITLNVEETSKSPFFNPADYDDGYLRLPVFNINNLKTIFPSDSYFYLWTREFKTEYSTGEHYHFMVIANHMTIGKLFDKRDELEKLIGIKTAWMASRLLPKDDPRTQKVHFHYLRQRDGIDGMNDAFLRYCYNAKIGQKISSFKRSFDGCRVLKPLNVISKKKCADFRRNTYMNNYEQELDDLANYGFEKYQKVA